MLLRLQNTFHHEQDSVLFEISEYLYEKYFMNVFVGPL